MIEKGDAEAQGRHFLYDNPMVIRYEGEDISLQKNFDIHQGLVDESSTRVGDMLLTPLCETPEKARAQFTILWQAKAKDGGEHFTAFVGEDWIVQRNGSGELKIVVLINSFHLAVPGLDVSTRSVLDG